LLRSLQSLQATWHLPADDRYTGTPGSIPAVTPADTGFHILPQLVGRMLAFPIRDYLIGIGTMEITKPPSRLGRDYLNRSERECYVVSYLIWTV
jgi:hypothetical protein